MENVAYFARKKVTMDKFTSQVKIVASSTINKVLNVDARATINSCESLNGYVSLSGKIKANVIYLSQENEISHSEIDFDFIERAQLDFNLEDIFATDKLELKSVNFSGSEVICIFEHNVLLNGNFKYEIPNFSNEDDDFVTKNTSFESLKYVSSCEDNFAVSEETEANLSNITILGTSADVIIYEATSLVDRVAVEGKIISNIIYSDEQGVSNYTREFEFKQEIACENIVPNLIISPLALVKGVSVTSSANENKTNLSYSVDLFVKALIYEENTYSLVDDMFSLKNKIQTTYDYIDARTFLKTKNYTDTFLMTTDVSNIENFDDVIGVYLPKFSLEQVEEVDGKGYINGTISADALYNANEQISKLEVKLPVKIEIIKEQNELMGGINVIPEITSYKVKAGKNLEVVCVLNYSVTFERNICSEFVKSYEIKGEKNEAQGGIKIYVTSQGETLFDVAKCLNVRPETITSQNEVLDTFEQGEKIYIYSPINLCN